MKLFHNKCKKELRLDESTGGLLKCDNCDVYVTEHFKSEAEK